MSAADSGSFGTDRSRAAVVSVGSVAPRHRYATDNDDNRVSSKRSLDPPRFEENRDHHFEFRFRSFDRAKRRKPDPMSALPTSMYVDATARTYVQ